jgi:glycosyltransferase involved in cell wall biosynthesis
MMERLTKAPQSVAMLGSFPPLRGISGYCFELAGAMAKRCRVEFLSFKAMYPRCLYPGADLADDPSFPDLDHPRLNIHRCMTWYNPLSWLNSGKAAACDLLHAQWWSLPLAPIYLTVCAAFKRQKKPVIFTVHNVLPHENAAAFIAASRILFNLGDHFIVHTEQNRRQLMTCYGIPGCRVSRIPHGTLDFQTRTDESSRWLRERLGLSPDERIVLLFGAIRPYKGVETALRAFAQVQQEMQGTHLVIAGKLWEDWERYDRLIRDLNLNRHVSTFLDYIPSGEVHRYFAGADLVILPYHHFDSQSGVGNTALSFRKPMIVSNVGGLPDLVSDPACIVPPKHPGALAQAILRCVRSPQRLAALSADAHNISNKYSWPAIAKSTFLVYKTSINKL